MIYVHTLRRLNLFHHVTSFFSLQFGIFNVQVTEALSQAGLESSNLIVFIDLTKSNEWTGTLLHGII